MDEAKRRKLEKKGWNGFGIFRPYARRKNTH
jgi:hypothetical protein